MLFLLLHWPRIPSSGADNGDRASHGQPQRCTPLLVVSHDKPRRRVTHSGEKMKHVFCLFCFFAFPFQIFQTSLLYRILAKPWTLKNQAWSFLVCCELRRTQHLGRWVVTVPMPNLESQALLQTWVSDPWWWLKLWLYHKSLEDLNIFQPLLTQHGRSGTCSESDRALSADRQVPRWLGSEPWTSAGAVTNYRILRWEKLGEGQVTSCFSTSNGMVFEHVCFPVGAWKILEVDGSSFHLDLIWKARNKRGQAPSVAHNPAYCTYSNLSWLRKGSRAAGVQEAMHTKTWVEIGTY